MEQVFVEFFVDNSLLSSRTHNHPFGLTRDLENGLEMMHYEVSVERDVVSIFQAMFLNGPQHRRI